MRLVDYSTGNASDIIGASVEGARTPENVRDTGRSLGRAARSPDSGPHYGAGVQRAIAATMVASVLVYFAVSNGVRSQVAFIVDSIDDLGTITGWW